MNKKYLILNHIPRCGGSSLRDAFYKATFGKNKFLPYISSNTHANICLSETPELAKAIHKQTNIFIDHSDAGVIENLFGLEDEKVYKILTIRDPVERFISHIHFFSHEKVTEMHDSELDESINQFGRVFSDKLSRHMNPKNKQESIHIAKKTLDDYDFIFKIEDKSCYERFNETNPFGITLEQTHSNQSKIEESVPDSKKQHIRDILSSEYDVLSKYYGD